MSPRKPPPAQPDPPQEESEGMFPSYVSSSSGGSTSSPLTVSSVGLGSVGTNRMALAFIVATRENATPSISSAQLGGEDMEAIASQSAVYQSDNVTVWLRALKESDLPSGASADLVVSGTYDAVIAGVALIENAEQSYSFDYDSYSSTARQSSWSNTISITPDALLIDGMGLYEEGGGATADTGQTEIVDLDEGVLGALLMSYEEGESSFESIGWSWSNSHRRQAHIIAALAYEAPPAAPEYGLDLSFNF